MAKFLTGKELENAIYNIISEANEQLLIVSPSIRVDDYFKKLFNHHLNKPKLMIEIIFGRSEDGKNLRPEDFEYFKQFPNISLVYVPNLNTRYYANESKGIVTSINLDDPKFRDNIEFGIFTEKSLLNNFTEKFDLQAWKFSKDLLNNNNVVFARRPVIDKKTSAWNYIKSEVVFDVTQQVIGNQKYDAKKLRDFPEYVEAK